jgi:endonuclease YncB( thermonuclease family)
MPISSIRHPSRPRRGLATLPLLLLLLLPVAAALPPAFRAECTRIVDGDTIDVAHAGETVRIRLEGIDCPERDQPFAEEARALTALLVEGKTVEVIAKEKDAYGRTAARVFVNGRDLSAELLKAGLATHYRKYNSDWLLASLERQARAGRVGMWGSELPPAPAPSPAAYHGNVRSRVFHSPACPHYDCPDCTRRFGSREEALAAGFRPCGRCRP